MGSCFSQAIGNRLSHGGMTVSVTSMGILFNPLSIARSLTRAFEHRLYTPDDLFKDESGVFHALDFESRRQHLDADSLLTSINLDFEKFSHAVSNCDCLLITFGTAWCFVHKPSDRLVGNCHKLPDKDFERKLCSVDEIVDSWLPIVATQKRIIFTVSPVRHLNDGLYGNTLSKARLHLAVEKLCAMFDNCEYFPAYEALIDDLRDYRFYADDLKHPSEMGEQYIFELFRKKYLDAPTETEFQSNLRRFKQECHRPIMK